MSNGARRRGGWVILVSFLIGYILTVMPLPDWLHRARPEWIALLLIYWCMALPERVGVFSAWLAGMFQDALQFSLLGQHALAYTLLAFLTVKLHQRIRLFPLWQQALVVLVLLMLTQLIITWINGFIGRPAGDWTHWLTVLTGTLLWPAVFLALRELRRSFDVR
jgi:rod shape-determining protein MreD